MAEEQSLNGVLSDVIQYFMFCKANAAKGSAAERKFTVYVEAVSDAKELLKKQEPRLMTLEEIPEYDGAFLIEYRHEVWPMQWALFRLNLTMSYRFIRGDSELGFSISKDFYGKTWRCWTARPTEEQREAEKWD